MTEATYGAFPRRTDCCHLDNDPLPGANMNIWTLSTALAMCSSSLVSLEGCAPALAKQPTPQGAPVAAQAQQSAVPTATAAGQAMDMGEGNSSTPTAPEGAHTAQSAATAAAQAKFDTLTKLIGKWAAPMGNGKTIVDTFQPFAAGTAILGEEWVDGQQITSTVFYLVGSELRADHYCDYLNQPHYVAALSGDPSLLDFQFREATNLDTHPRHFHATTWRLLDATHLTQDWDVEGGPKGHAEVHFEFVRQP